MKKKLYFRNKHKLYEMKAEELIRPNGLTSYCRKPFPGSFADINILSKNIRELGKRILESPLSRA